MSQAHHRTTESRESPLFPALRAVATDQLLDESELTLRQGGAILRAAAFWCRQACGEELRVREMERRDVVFLAYREHREA